MVAAHLIELVKSYICDLSVYFLLLEVTVWYL
jgi:hypothetical protein